jgi:stearoyl-CoA desaturase (Delta-9 desaturase)
MNDSIAAIKAEARQKPIDWVNSLFLILTPLVAFTGTAWYTWHYGVTKLDFFNFFFMFWATGLSITGGYHRFYSHRTYQCSKPLQLFYLLFGAAAVENSVINWCSDHRYHHRFVDTDEDPYNILKGGLYAHMGWILFKDTRNKETRFDNIPDLMKDPLVRWQDKYYLPIVLIFSFALPTYIGLLGGRPLGGLLWGGLMRVVVVHHMTFFINSLAHLYGTRPYSITDTARDNWLLGPFTFGEGYHNFHHKFQADYRNGVKWYAFDPGKWWLWAMKWIGQAWSLKRTPEPLILKAALEVQMRHVESKLASVGAPQRLWELAQSRMALGRARLEKAMVEYQLAAIEYRHQKDKWSADARAQFYAKLEEYRSEFEEARKRWQFMVSSLSRIPQGAQGLLTLTALLDLMKNAPKF